VDAENQYLDGHGSGSAIRAKGVKFGEFMASVCGYLFTEIILL